MKEIIEKGVKLKDKNAQVTVFIIIGIVLVISVGIVLFIRSETSKVWIERIMMPEEVIPVRQFVTNCLESTARDGINRIGATGGFTTIYPEIAMNPKARIDIFPEANMIIPLWYYRGLEYKPTLHEMQHRLAQYVEDNLGECIGNFEGFQQKFEIEELSKPEVRRARTGREVEDFGEKDVNVNMIYSLKITSRADQEETRMSLFNVRVPIRLRKAFELAEEIFEAENEQLFLEEQMISLMSLSEEVVPITDVRFGECSPLVVSVFELKKRVQDLAQYNIPNTIINDTKTKQLMPDNWYPKLHQTYDLDIEKTDLAVEFSYDGDWDMDFLVSPNRGRMIRADPIKLLETIPTCILQYHFVYDLRFPVRISIIDDEARDHESFVFNFAMPVVINHNEGDKVPDPRHVVFDNAILPAEDYCEGYPKIDMEIKAVNKVTFDDISDVSLTYRCSSAECDIGNITKYQGLKASVPKCTNALITARKEGYLDAEQYVEVTEPGRVEIDMMPADKIPFKIVKRRLHNPRVRFSMQEGDVALLTMTNPKYDHTSIGVYDPMNPELAEIEILSQWNYDYDVEVILISGDRIVGGYKGNWTVKGGELMVADELEISVFEIEEIKTMPEEQAGEQEYYILTDMAELSKNVTEPKFI
ncbi:hypothetical protein KY345_05715 [Candidatus Woesearchaeota archaeon]|nr:hypothetical protein [Candidatus Woesearchaeota archaeon]